MVLALGLSGFNGSSALRFFLCFLLFGFLYHIFVV